MILSGRPSPLMSWNIVKPLSFDLLPLIFTPAVNNLDQTSNPNPAFSEPPMLNPTLVDEPKILAFSLKSPLEFGKTKSAVILSLLSPV